MRKLDIAKTSLLLYTSCFLACGTDTTKDTVVIAPNFEVIKIDTAIMPKRVSDLATSIDYVPLETSDETMIGKVDKLEIFNDLIFILDKKAAKSLSVYTQGGKFLFQKKVNKNEMRKIEDLSDFFIDRKNYTLYVLAGDNKSILLYNIPSGTYIKNIKIKGYFTNLAVVHPDSILLLRDGLTRYDDYYDEYRICQIDSSGKLIKRWVNNSLTQYVSGGGITSTNGENKLIISRMFNDTLYCFENGKINAVYKIDLGMPSVPNEFYAAKDMNQFKNLMMAPNTFFIQSGNIFHTKNSISFLFKSGQSYCFFMYDRKTKKGNLSKYLINDIDNTMMPFMSYINDSLLVSVIDASALQQQFNLVSSTPNFKSKYSKLIELNGLITQDANPVLAFLRLKE